jgi:hypothetical protein
MDRQARHRGIEGIVVKRQRLLRERRSPARQEPGAAPA